MQVGTELQSSREIVFGKGSASTLSTGLNIVGFQSAVEGSISQSFEEKTGRSSAETYTVTLNPDICLHWRVEKYETRVTGYYSAPALGVNEERPFTVPESRRLQTTNLCL
ncbi:MAG: hypothetical protein AAB276_03485, partial [Pseudomonadota bacterium]